VRFAYADPPYLGLAAKFYGHLHADAAAYDDPETHRLLIERLCADYDGWALSLHTPTLKTMLNFCPDDVRVGAWMKPFCSFKKNVTRAYAWEPILLWGGRKIPITQNTVRDWFEAPAIPESITLRRGFTGAKPAAVIRWIFDWWNMEDGDQFDDLFPGSGAVTEAYEAWQHGLRGIVQGGLFQERAA
jgi:hypothetical protein